MKKRDNQKVEVQLQGCGGDSAAVFSRGIESFSRVVRDQSHTYCNSLIMYARENANYTAQRSGGALCVQRDKMLNA